MNIHFISSVDGYMLNDILADIDPKTTLFVKLPQKLLLLKRQ